MSPRLRFPHDKSSAMLVEQNFVVISGCEILARSSIRSSEFDAVGPMQHVRPSRRSPRSFNAVQKVTVLVVRSNPSCERLFLIQEWCFGHDLITSSLAR